MARMLGSGAYYGIPCTCCNGPRTVQVERRREKRAWQREAELDVPPFGSNSWSDWASAEDALYDDL